ncbi:MAG: twin-arginine translocase TatA/TatE family subunit [Anaerolineales bacterium]|nr:twin-arginine translocase TatA/TatE family subunit [Anaerolineales bacterium]MCK5634003.1 twin-arginine translocase TatA/TatE family subunit [Anaerolineales bacterium]
MTLPRGWELIIILIIIVLIFGPGRLSKIAGEIGQGIKEFRTGIQDDESEDGPSDEEETADEA